jgi:hypothetical protein
MLSVEINVVEVQHHLNKMQFDTLNIKTKGIGFHLTLPFRQSYQNPMQMQKDFWNKKWVRKRPRNLVKRPRNNILKLM